MAVAADVEIVHCHAGGEVGDVVIAGVSPPPGNSIAEQAAYLAADNRLRNFLLQEPRGGVFRHANLLVPPIHPAADAAFIIMEPADTPPMSGSNAMCVATVLLERGILPMTEPQTRLTLEAPGGLVEITAYCERGKVLHVCLENLASFVSARDRPLALPDLPGLQVQVAFGGDSFVIVDVKDCGLEILPENAAALARLGTRITAAANQQIGFEHPVLEACNAISFCLFRTLPVRKNNQLSVTHAVAIRPGKIDRSPTGTGVSAHLALLHAQGHITAGEELRARSIIGSEFRGRIAGQSVVAGWNSVRPVICGQAEIFGESRFSRNESSPWPEGYRLNDTWPDG